MAVSKTGVWFLRHLRRSNQANNLVFRCLSSKRENEINVSVDPLIDPNRIVISPELKQKLLNENVSDHWQCYGFDEKNREADTVIMHFIAFCAIGMTLVGFGFLFTYSPQMHRPLDWARREAYLQIHARESAGLPLIDKNYVDPSTVVLPSDEELGNLDIPI